MKKLQLLILFQSIILCAMLLGGCASSSSGASFPGAVTRQAFDVHYGEVIGTRDVEIEGEATIVGRLGGALIGRAIAVGNSGDFGSDRRIQGSIGAVGGSVAGEAIERELRRKDGIEIVVRLDSRETIAVVQDTDIDFETGDRVRVLMGPDGSTRVQPL